MRTLRWPAVIVIVAALGAALAYDRDHAEPPAPVGRPVAALGPVVAAEDARTSTWFCAAGTGETGGLADHTVEVVNTVGAERTGTLTVYTSKVEGAVRAAPVTRAVTVPPFGRVRVRLADVAGARPYLSAAVEMAGGGVVVEHTLTGKVGAARTPVGSTASCSTTASSRWYVPVGATNTVESPTAREILFLFNPFPEDAVVDLSFSTNNGTRAPDAFTALVVSSASVLAVDVTQKVTVANEVSASVVARRGRLVVDRLQVFDDVARQRRGMTVNPAVPGVAPDWFFPQGALAPGRVEQLFLYNPGAERAEVQVQVRPDDPQQSVEPFSFTISGGRHLVLNLTGEGRMIDLLGGADDDAAGGTPAATSVGYSIAVLSTNGVGVAAERLVTTFSDGVSRGVASSTGSVVGATRLLAAAGGAFLRGRSALLRALTPVSFGGGLPAHPSLRAAA